MVLNCNQLSCYVKVLGYWIQQGQHSRKQKLHM